MTNGRQSAAEDAKSQAGGAKPGGMIVTVDPSVELESLLGPLAQAGFKVNERLDAINVLTGHAGPDAVAALRELPGVVSVEDDKIVRLDPREVPDMGKDFAEQAQTFTPKVVGSSWRSPNWVD